MPSAKRTAMPSIHNRLVLVTAFAAAFLCGSPELEAKELSVETIVHKTNQTSYYQGKDGRARVKMTITDKSGRNSILCRDSLKAEPTRLPIPSCLTSQYKVLSSRDDLQRFSKVGTPPN